MAKTLRLRTAFAYHFATLPRRWEGLALLYFALLLLEIVSPTPNTYNPPSLLLGAILFEAAFFWVFWVALSSIVVKGTWFPRASLARVHEGRRATPERIGWFLRDLRSFLAWRVSGSGLDDYIIFGIKKLDKVGDADVPKEYHQLQAAFVAQASELVSNAPNAPEAVAPLIEPFRALLDHDPTGDECRTAIAKAHATIEPWYRQRAAKKESPSFLATVERNPTWTLVALTLLTLALSLLYVSGRPN